MEKRYFVKFIGEKNVTLAVANTAHDAETLKSNQFEETTASFYNWVQEQTTKIS